MNDFPRRFGSYLLLKPLARGGMGALYLALSGPGDSAKLCVIKTVLPHLADKEYLQRFRDEAKVVVRLSHGNLVPVFDSGQVAGEIYLAMDFVEGKDLRATWNRCAKKGIAFPIDVAAHIVKELVRGLHYAHGFGAIKLVHRDVSPPNVLLSYSGEVKLTDFGLAASTLKLEKTAPGIIYGKVSYMSPEQARGEPLDGRTDLYAAGIILWELLTGRQLFPSGKPAGAAQEMQTSEELLRRVRNPDLLAPSKRATRVPPELDRITLKALAPELKDRYASCEELRLDLATFLAQTSPATDSVRVSSFLADLYGPDIELERTERETLIGTARESFSSGALPRAAVAGLASAGPAEDAKSAAPASPASSMPGKPGANGPGRPEKGTLVAGPARHDHALDKRNTEALPAQSSDPRSNQAQFSAAVVGTVVGGRYYVRRLCGEGGMGRVYEAEHIDIGKRVALKILHPAYSQTPDLVERLRREARAASKISHANVVDVTDSGTTPDGAFFFVMEYLEGIELGELIFQEGKLDVRRALHIGEQVCRALQAAHEVQVIHRDLKPENVLILARDGHRDFVKVLDFGIAKSGELDDEKDSQGRLPRRLTHPGMTMGTPEYMAPEQAAGRPADPRSDIYAVGGLLYEMLSGNPPYEGENFMEILHKKANGLPAPLSTLREDVPPTLEKLIARTLAKEPAARPQSMEELARELHSIAMMAYPSLAKIQLDGVGDSGAPRLTPATLGGLRPVQTTTSAHITRLRVWERKKVLVAAGGLLGLALAVAGFGSLSASRRAARARAAAAAAAATVHVAEPRVLTAPALPPVPPLAPAAAPVIADTAEPAEAAPPPEGEGGPVAEKEPSGRRDGDGGRSSARAARIAAAAGEKKLLEEGERLLRAERFTEARQVFEKLSHSRRGRGLALVGLAEISFQEKNYAQAVRSAGRASERGGGVRARVLLGDAHFRLNHFKEAARAYEDALKLDPANASAKSGLALANKRM
jgi:eukaryotic-like serine/threonine-protein kinase